MTSNKAFEFLYGYYLYMHHHNVTLHEMYDFMKEGWEKIGKDLEILEILNKEPYLSLNDYYKGTDEDFNFYLEYRIEPKITREEYFKVKEWLER